jgi:hypothetical protein
LGGGDKSKNGKQRATATERQGPRTRRTSRASRSAAREIGRFSLSKRAGLDFAKATGDFNPIHWAPRYAKAMGFRSVILHGFGSLSWAFEGSCAGSTRATSAHRRDRRELRAALVLPRRSVFTCGGTASSGSATRRRARLHAGQSQTRI